MQLTIEIPDKLAKELEPKQDRLAEIIARGLRRSWTGNSGLRREVVSFLARRPTVGEMMEFRPSKAAVKRSRELLARHQNGALSAEEEAELDADVRSGQLRLAHQNGDSTADGRFCLIGLAPVNGKWQVGSVLEASLIERMSVAERLQVMEQLWDALARESGDIGSPEWHRGVLADRKARAERGEAKFLTLAQLRSRLRGSEP